MKNQSFEEALGQIMNEDPRFDERAYLFIREALDYTITALDKPMEGPGRHVSGQELMEGVREFALQEFGPMTKTVLNAFGIKTTEDIGDVVFNLVEKGILGKTDEDKRADFASGYTFDEAFRRPFEPRKKTRKPRKKTPKES